MLKEVAERKYRSVRRMLGRFLGEIISDKVFQFIFISPDQLLIGWGDLAFPAIVESTYLFQFSQIKINAVPVRASIDIYPGVKTILISASRAAANRAMTVGIVDLYLNKSAVSSI